MNILPPELRDDAAPMGFFATWRAMALFCYKWLALPLALLLFFIGGGWTAWRVMHQGYEQTTGVVTEYSCGKNGRIEYTYYAGKYPYHNTGPNSGCRSYAPGETVPVYYSTARPELAVANGTPGAILRQDLMMSLFGALVLPLLGGLGAAMKTLRNR